MTTRKTSDYLYDIGLGLEPKYDKLIIEAMDECFSDRIASLISELKVKELAGIQFIKENLLNPLKGDQVKDVSAQNEAYSEVVKMLENKTQETLINTFNTKENKQTTKPIIP